MAGPHLTDWAPRTSTSLGGVERGRPRRSRCCGCCGRARVVGTQPPPGAPLTPWATRPGPGPSARPHPPRPTGPPARSGTGDAQPPALPPPAFTTHRIRLGPATASELFAIGCCGLRALACRVFSDCFGCGVLRWCTCGRCVPFFRRRGRSRWCHCAVGLYRPASSSSRG